MLKTNSKQARQNTRAYIIDHFNPDTLDFNGDSSIFPVVALYLMERFEREKQGKLGTRAELFAVCRPCWTHAIIIIDPQLMIWAQSWRRQKPKKHATPKNKPRKC